MKSLYSKIVKKYQVSNGGLFHIEDKKLRSIDYCEPAIRKKNVRQEKSDYEDEELEGQDSEYENRIAEAQRQADKIIADAKDKAAQIIKDAENFAAVKADSVRKQAEKQGYEAGYHAGHEELQELIKDIKGRHKKAVSEYKKSIGEFEANAIKMVMSIARKVISEEVSINKENVLLLIRNALENYTDRDGCIVKLNPADYDYVIENKKKLLSVVDDLEKLEIKKEYQYPEGSCIIETQFGTIDAGVETKLTKVEEAFGISV